MNDADFRKAIQDKMDWGNKELPDEFIWKNLDKELAMLRQKKRRRVAFIFFLLPLLGAGFFCFFSKKTEVPKLIKTDKIALKNQASQNTETAKNRIKKKVNSETALRSKNEENKPLFIKKSKISASKPLFNAKTEDVSQSNFTEKTMNPAGYSNANPQQHTAIFKEKKDFQNTQIQAIEKQIPLLHTKTTTPLPATLFFLKSKSPPLPKPTLYPIEKLPKKTEQNGRKFVLNLQAEQNNLAVCFDDKAQHQALKIGIQYAITPKIRTDIALGYHQSDYAFEVEEESHLKAFGNTDKYPQFYTFSQEANSISNNLDYFSASVGMSFHQPISKHWSASLGASQDFIFNQKQSILYQFNPGMNAIKISTNDNGIKRGMTGFQVGVHRSFGQRVSLGLLLNRYITTQTIGVEMQYYHGFGGALRAEYSLFQGKS